MINTLRSEDRIKLVSDTHYLISWRNGYCFQCVYNNVLCLHKQVVRLESGWTDHVRYMVVVYTNGRQDTEENILLGMDFTDKDR